jgi:hypothetical protein
VKQDQPILARELPPGFSAGPMQGFGIIGETTEALHRFLLDGWSFDTPPPRIEEDLSFVPKDREEVLYVYMYRVTHNTSLMNSKHWRPAKVTLFGSQEDGPVYYERPPLYLNLFYLVAFHSKFRSDTERLLGWLLLRLHDATHLVYRPRKYTLPNGEIVDSLGRPYQVEAEDHENLVMEKVAVGMVDDLTVGDAINFFTIHEAPFRPFLTYRAMCSLEGSLIAGTATQVRMSRSELMNPDERPPHERANGRLGRMELGGTRAKPIIGPPGHNHRPIQDETTEDDSED